MVSVPTFTRVWNFLIRTHEDENREVAVDYLEEIIACMAKKDLTATTLAVLFNLFNDFGMSLLHCCRAVTDKPRTCA